jgi:glucose dehydrogenase
LGKLVCWLVAAILTIVGAVLVIGGTVLALHGGSIYYVPTGLAVLVSAFGLARHQRYAAWAFGAMLAWTIVWSLWEAGLDDWALMPRLVGPAIVGLLFLLPPIHRAIAASRWWVGGPALAALLFVGAAVVRTETAESGLPSAAKVAALSGAAQDWRNWGNGLGGTKFAAIDQINLSNVGDLKLAWRFDNPLKPGELRSLEAAPLAADGRLYMCLESGTIAALDQDTGKRIW